MKITYTLSTNFSFDYWCPVCGVLLGNSKDDTELSHPVTRDEWVKSGDGVTFRGTPLCIWVGKQWDMPKHKVEAETAWT